MATAVPLDDMVTAECACTFSLYVDSDEPSYHYCRRCQTCGQCWYGLHCPHEGGQTPCPACGVVPLVVYEALEGA